MLLDVAPEFCNRLVFCGACIGIKDLVSFNVALVDVHADDFADL